MDGLRGPVNSEPVAKKRTVPFSRARNSRFPQRGRGKVPFFATGSPSSGTLMLQYIVVFACPNCQHKLRIKEEYLGRTLRCKYCAHEFVSPPPEDEILNG